MKAMVFNSAGDDALHELIRNPRIGFQQKYDGTRAVVEVLITNSFTEVKFLARGGGPLKHTAAMQWFGGITEALIHHTDGFYWGRLVLDGEIMIDSGRFIVFDLLEHWENGEQKIGPEYTYAERMEYLVKNFGEKFQGLVAIAQTYLDETVKQEFYDRLLESGAEGIMAKDMLAPYEPGKRVSHSLKIKFTKTCDMIATSYDLHRNEAGNLAGNIEFGLPCRGCHQLGVVAPVVEDGGVAGPLEKCPICDGSGVEPFGSCSAIGKPECVGKVIEVKYLYRQKNGGLVQPTMLRIREDKEPHECTWDQFVDYEKAVLS